MISPTLPVIIMVGIATVAGSGNLGSNDTEDALFYIIVVMITFTAIAGTYLFYRDSLVRFEDGQEELDDQGLQEADNEDCKEPINLVPRIEEPVQLSDIEEVSSTSSSSSSCAEDYGDEDVSEVQRDKATAISNKEESTRKNMNEVKE